MAQLLITRDGIDPATAHASAAAAQSHIGMARRYATHPETRQRRTHVLALTARISTVADAIYAAAELLDTAQHDAQQATAERDAQEKKNSCAPWAQAKPEPCHRHYAVTSKPSKTTKNAAQPATNATSSTGA